MPAAPDSRPMSRHEVPTHLDVPDKAFFGLAAPQFLCLLLGATLALVLWREWTFLPAGVRLALAAGAVLVALAGALIRPQGRDLATWAVVLLRYAALPKTAVWRPRAPAPAPVRAAGPDVGWVDWTPRIAWAPEPGPEPVPPQPIPPAIRPVRPADPQDGRVPAEVGW